MSKRGIGELRNEDLHLQIEIERIRAQQKRLARLAWVSLTSGRREQELKCEIAAVLGKDEMAKLKQIAASRKKVDVASPPKSRLPSSLACTDKVELKSKLREKILASIVSNRLFTDDEIRFVFATTIELWPKRNERDAVHEVLSALEEELHLGSNKKLPRN